MSRLLLAALLFTLTGCGGGLPDFMKPKEWSPDRSAFASLSPSDQILQGEALDKALESNEGTRIPWQGVEPPVGGEIRVGETVQMDGGLVCRRFDETLTVAGGTTNLLDGACWSGGRWVYLRRQPPRPPVLVGPWPADRTRVTTARTNVAALARANKVPVATLQRLNPGLPRTIPKGTTIRLP